MYSVLKLFRALIKKVTVILVKEIKKSSELMNYFLLSMRYNIAERSVSKKKNKKIINN